jgi:hypothetical protein
MIKYFVGGDMGCALLVISDKPLHLFPQPCELFSRSSRPGKGELQLADVQSKTRELFEAELVKLN